MKKTDDSKVSYKILELVLRADRCDIWLFQNFDNSTLYYALLILGHPRFTRDIEAIRKELDIALVDYPIDKDISDISGLAYYYGLEKYQEISKKVHGLLAKYNLWDNWFVPLTTYVVSGVLPVAGKNNAIEWYPIMEKNHFFIGPTSANWDTYDEYAFLENLYGERVKYPSISITEKLTSKNQLKEWIDENWDTLIEPELRNIPSRLKKAASVERLAIGLWLWEMRDLKKMSWEEIDREIRRVEDTSEGIWGDDKNDLAPTTAKGPDLIYSAKQALSEFYPL